MPSEDIVYASAQMDAATAQAWERWCDSRIERALAAQRDDVAELARSIVEFVNAVDKKLCELQTLLTKLSAVHEQLRAHDARQPFDLPNPLVRRVN
jgi:uncharacterized coiled-coil protein SlyX